MIAGDTTITTNWKIIEIWNRKKSYPNNTYVLYNNKVYLASVNTLSMNPIVGAQKSNIPLIKQQSPDETSSWDYKSSLVPDTNTVYSNGNIIEISHPERRRYKVLPNGNYEPVMIKDPNSLYERKRSNKLLKVKRFEDTEATVIGH